MGKFRSKIKGSTKGKRWQKGRSANSNPKIQKYREMAKSRFFQENLGSSGLTQQAIHKHDAIITYGHSTGKQKSEAENELTIAKEFENMSVKTGDDDTETECGSSSVKTGTFKTFKTFASDWSQCSNVSFNKLLIRFDSKNALHKDMLAVLAAVTEALKEEGGKESTTEYYAALMQTLKSSEDENSIVATLSLLSMGIKSLHVSVMRNQFSDSAATFTEILEKNAHTENSALLRSAIGCLSVLLRAQEYDLWEQSSTLKVFDSVLAFSLHSKPKIRKAAQHAVAAILRGSRFLLLWDQFGDKNKARKVHPAANRAAEYCLSQIKPEALLSGHRSVLHTLTMLRDILPVFTKEYIKSICEAILSLMTHNNVYIKTCCLHTLHALFSCEASNLPPGLGGQLTRALLAARPPPTDTGQVLAWAAVLQQGYGRLAKLDLNLCLPNLSAFVGICVSELWLSDVAEINAASTNALKAILLDCVKPAINSDTFANHKAHIDAIFKMIGTGLDNPFNQAIKHVIMTIAVCFEIGDEKVGYALRPLLKKMIERRESNNFHHEKEVEYATGCAIKTLGPEFVLKIIPIRSEDGINLERSWLIPVLKEKICNANLKYFATEILELATFCRKKSRELQQANDIPGSHTYDLLCNQLWALLPSFCNSPKDIKDSFKAIARVLGNVLKDNPEFRLSVMQALRKLITGAETNADSWEVGRFAKNYLPILLNIYMTPVKGSSGEGQRLAALETIQVYLTISEQRLIDELFDNALKQLESSQDNYFQRESILDVIRLLVIYLEPVKIGSLFDKWSPTEVVLEDPKKKKAKKEKEDGMEIEEGKSMKYKDKLRLLEMEHKKAFRILEELFKSDRLNCKAFLKANYKNMKKMLMSSNKAGDSSKAARLRCIEHLIKSNPSLTPESKFLKNVIAEAVVCTKDINSKCRLCAFNLIGTVGNILKIQNGGTQAFIDMVSSGLSAPLPRVASAAVRALAWVLHSLYCDMSLQTVQNLFEKVAEQMKSKNREIVAACMSFLKVYRKVLPTDVLAGSLPLIFTTFSTMSDDCKRHSRIEIGYFLSRVMSKFGADFVEKLVPSTDHVMLKRLKNIRKMDNRKKRLKDNQKDHESDSDTEMQLKGTSKTLEDILRDSDSDMEYLDDERPKIKAKGRNKAWIQDDVENIVDLADVSSARKITATDPTQKKKVTEEKPQKKDGGFRTAPDGRLIISDDMFADDDDENKPSGDIDSDTDDTDDEAGPSKASKLLKAGTKRRINDALSVRSGRSSRSRAPTATLASQASHTSKYKAGGKGIHRALGSGASVASGSGTEFRSKKAKGDIKKKGKHDPYAYLPLSRKNLNKRKKAVTSKQFKGIVKSKTKGVKVRTKKN